MCIHVNEKCWTICGNGLRGAEKFQGNTVLIIEVHGIKVIKCQKAL